MDDVNNLFSLVKEFLKITWNDPETDKRILDMVLNAKETLSHKLGIPLEEAGEVFLRHGQEQNLFQNYCMYDWNHCLNEFDKAYSNEIMQLRIKYEVLSYEKKQLQ